MKYYIKKVKNKFPWVSIGALPDYFNGEIFSGKYMYKVTWDKKWYNYYNFAKLKDAKKWLNKIGATYTRIK